MTTREAVGLDAHGWVTNIRRMWGQKTKVPLVSEVYGILLCAISLVYIWKQIKSKMVEHDFMFPCIKSCNFAPFDANLTIDIQSKP